MTWGNFTRASLGYHKRTWLTTRDVIAAIVNGYARHKISGSDIVDFGITELPEAPWLDYNFKERDEERRHIQDRQVSNLLKRYNVHPKNIRLSSGVLKGYDLKALQKAGARYLPVDTPEIAATPLQPSKHKASSDIPTATNNKEVADINPDKPLQHKEARQEK